MAIEPSQWADVALTLAKQLNKLIGEVDPPGHVASTDEQAFYVERVRTRVQTLLAAEQEVTRLLAALDALEKRFEMLEWAHREVCNPLQEVCQKQHLGLCGENVAEVVVAELKRLQAALDAQGEALRQCVEALALFTPGSEWGTWLADLVHGAPEHSEGIVHAKEIVRRQSVAYDAHEKAQRALAAVPAPSAPQVDVRIGYCPRHKKHPEWFGQYTICLYCHQPLQYATVSELGTMGVHPPSHWSPDKALYRFGPARQPRRT